MKKGKPATPLVGTIFSKIAPHIGAKVLLEPQWGIAGQITFRSGRKRYFRYSSIDLNTLGASEIAKDKDYANFFMKGMGYKTVPGKVFFSDTWAKAIESTDNIDGAYAYAQTIGLPVIVKPNSGSQGKGVALVHTKREFYRAMRRIFAIDRVALVQQPVSGKDYRVVVLDDRIISAYERVPLNVVGDGRSTIRQLLAKKQRAFAASSRDTVIKPDDLRMGAKLKRAGLTMDTVPHKAQRVFLLDNANLSTGGDSIDVTAMVHPDFKKIAVQLTRDMGLKLCGVDLMIQGDISLPPKEWWVLEINSAPGLDHYASSGKAQQKIVEDMYLKVLKSMEHA
jgi:D-alanine-D-alanine ligase-like ATP-grasp enzyme